MGFADGESSFCVTISKNASTTIGKSVKLNLNIVQHNRDKELLIKLIEVFEGGKVFAHGSAESCSSFTVNRIGVISNNIIPFFNKYPLQGIKYNDFQDFVEVVKIMEKKWHLTEEGINQIQLIKNRMNKKK